MTSEKSAQLPYTSTPLIRSAYLSDLCGVNVHLKLENTQPSGSFKTRGISELIRRNLEKDPKCHVFSSSGGNAGLAAATAAKFYGVQCTVVVPKLTKVGMIERIKKLQAEVIVHGEHWAQADAHLRELVAGLPAGTSSVYCHPFDDPIIWEGHSTLSKELKDQMVREPDAIIASVGGGGLLNGVALGVDANGWKSTKLVAVETNGAATLHTSLRAGHPVTLDKIDTVATSLGSVYVSEKTFEIGQQDRTRAMLVSDSEAIDAIVRFAEDHKIIVEPACGAALAVCYSQRLAEVVPDLGPDANVVVVVCGGTGTSLDQLNSYRGV